MAANWEVVVDILATTEQDSMTSQDLWDTGKFESLSSLRSCLSLYSGADRAPGILRYMCGRTWRYYLHPKTKAAYMKARGKTMPIPKIREETPKQPPSLALNPLELFHLGARR